VARLIEEWQLFDHVIIDRAIKQRHPRPWSCACEQGGQPERQPQLNPTSPWLPHAGNPPSSALHPKRSQTRQNQQHFQTALRLGGDMAAVAVLKVSGKCKKF